MEYVFTPAATPSLQVAGQAQQFPVNRIFCVGRNYAAHAIEMGKDPTRDLPFFFMKPGSAVVQAGAEEVSIPYPPMTKNFHHEIELVVAIGKGGSNIPVASALEHIYGYAIGLDMTRRDLQLEARDKGRPWEFGKSFSKSAPVGPIHRAEDIGHPSQAAISVTVNGTVKQSSDINLLIWSVAECIADLSRFETLEPGDIIMTGTPEGVNAVVPGDVMRGAIAGMGEIVVRVEAK
ncbi:MAG: fumarylacetoacetate hydrolase family protein [Pseudomonadota bacterium]